MRQPRARWVRKEYLQWLPPEWKNWLPSICGKQALSTTPYLPIPVIVIWHCPWFNHSDLALQCHLEFFLLPCLQHPDTKYYIWFYIVCTCLHICAYVGRLEKYTMWFRYCQKKKDILFCCNKSTFLNPQICWWQKNKIIQSSQLKPLKV